MNSSPNLLPHHSAMPSDTAGFQQTQGFAQDVPAAELKCAEPMVLYKGKSIQKWWFNMV
jgi:hypothetical protein